MIYEERIIYHARRRVIYIQINIDSNCKFQIQYIGKYFEITIHNLIS